MLLRGSFQFLFGPANIPLRRFMLQPMRRFVALYSLVKLCIKLNQAHLSPFFFENAKHLIYIIPIAL